MRPQDIIIGETYRHHSNPNIGYAKAIEIINGKTGINTNTYKVVKCEWSMAPNDTFGFIKYFRPCDLQKGGTK